MTTYSTLLSQMTGGGGRRALEVPADWLQGRTVFGGLQVAVAVQAMRDLVPDAPLRSVQATFIAPATGDLTASATVLRTGKSVTHVQAQLGAGEVQTIVVGVFGVGRSSRVQVTPRQVPVTTGEPRPMVYVPGLVPAFTQHFAVQWLEGSPPFTGDTSTRHVIEVSLRDEGPATEAHVFAFADFIPPMGLSHLKAPAPGSSVTWMLDFIAGDVSTLGLERWRVDADLMFARDGYTSQSLVLWGPNGEPVALGRQAMTVFD